MFRYNIVAALETRKTKGIHTYKHIDTAWIFHTQNGGGGLGQIDWKYRSGGRRPPVEHLLPLSQARYFGMDHIPLQCTRITCMAPYMQSSIFTKKDVIQRAWFLVSQLEDPGLNERTKKGRRNFKGHVAGGMCAKWAHVCSLSNARCMYAG